MVNLALPQGFSITQPFGGPGFALEPAHPGCPHFHEGIDYAVPANTPVLAPASARVQQVIHSTTGYGNHVILDVGDGTTVLLGHLNRIDVQPGQVLQAGQSVGLSGSTGASTGPHLHFEVRKGGVPINPETVSAAVNGVANVAGSAASAVGNLFGNVTAPISGAGDALGAVGDVLGRLGQPDTWIRAVMLIGGIGLVIIGGAWLVANGHDD